MLELRDILYYYKSNREKRIINHLNYRFEEGRVYAILGASGTGKTTLLSLMAGLDIPCEGEILVRGNNMLERGLNWHRRHNISLVFQNYNLIDYLTPIENVKLGGDRCPEELLAAGGLTEEEFRRSVGKLSGGQQQRVAIARAMASDAPILLADEPTGNLDEKTAEGITELFLRLAHVEQKCVIIVTHSSQVAERADVILRLKDGAILNDKELFYDEQIRQGLKREVPSISFSEEEKKRLQGNLYPHSKR